MHLLLSTLLALSATARADDDEPLVCQPLLDVPDQGLSVAWVAPAGRHVPLSGWMTVVSTRALRAWLAEEGTEPVRVLRGLGLRKRARPPKAPWVVGIFEVMPEDLCRPVSEDAGAIDPAGVPVCQRFDRGLRSHDDGCGYAIDYGGELRSLDVFRIRWRDAAAKGFCMLPLERFVQGR